jgi:tRNA (mo5U34)-methyltransferase
MKLDYLLPYKDKVDFDFLLNLKEGCDTWIERKSNTELKELLDSLPEVEDHKLDLSQDAVVIGSENSSKKEQYIELARKLIPWRKGPFNFYGEKIDAEWRSDFKWNRLKDHVDNLEGKTVLDIGCNNGYFLFRMANQNPELLLGIDPVIQCETQFKFLQHFAKVPNLHFEMFGVEHLNSFKQMFDVIFSMGIIYHHRHPLEQLINIREALKPGGQAIIETIGIPGDESYALFPEDRYAKMRNVFFVPTLSCFINWLKKAKLIDVEVISSTPLTFEEQRLTNWCPPPSQSLEDFLDPNDLSKTIEGHPAPMRFCLKARKKPAQNAKENK